MSKLDFDSLDAAEVASLVSTDVGDALLHDDDIPDADDVQQESENFELLVDSLAAVIAPHATTSSIVQYQAKRKAAPC